MISAICEKRIRRVFEFYIQLRSVSLNESRSHIIRCSYRMVRSIGNANSILVRLYVLVRSVRIFLHCTGEDGVPFYLYDCLGSCRLPIIPERSVAVLFFQPFLCVIYTTNSERVRATQRTEICNSMIQSIAQRTGTARCCAFDVRRGTGTEALLIFVLYLAARFEQAVGLTPRLSPHERVEILSTYESAEGKPLRSFPP